jgi:hypothetical protein
LRDITIKTERTRVEELFVPYRTLIGHDFDGYRNHVYRCITYAMHFLDNASEHEQMVETAFVRIGRSIGTSATVFRLMSDS